MTCPTREELVAVLDGALAPDALTAARRHVDGCDRCRAELARLESGVALLRAGSPAVEPSPFFATRLAARLAAERPRRRRELSFFLGTPWRLAAAGGLVAVVVAGLAAGVVRARHARSAEELAVAERLDLLEDLEVVASVGEVDGPDDVAAIAALDEKAPREGRP
jgi:anti-sigma factor RsiW